MRHLKLLFKSHELAKARMDGKVVETSVTTNLQCDMQQYALSQ
jgi:hypothetical protein